MKKIIKLVAIVIILIMVYPLYYRLNHVELTSIEIFIKFWYLYVFGILSSILIIYLNNKSK